MENFINLSFVPLFLMKHPKRVMGAVAALALAGVALRPDSSASVPAWNPSPTIASFLEDPYAVIKAEGVRIPDDFYGSEIRGEHVRIALSNLAEACLNFGVHHAEHYAEAQDCIATVVNVALNPELSPYGMPVEDVDSFGEYGIYLSHLNIVLGTWKQLTKDDSYTTLNTRISEHLAEQTIQEQQHTLKSYPDLPYRWPADQSVVLYSLFLYDQNYGTDISKEPIELWTNYMKQHGTDPETGLHVSEITGMYPRAEQPRGCALSWTLRYMAHFAPEEAGLLWQRYKEHFKQNYGIVVGFREWKKGYSSFADVDSGPIIVGNGVAATAFAIGASKELGDERTYHRLLRTAAVGNAGSGILGIDAVAESLLAESILFNVKE